MWSSPCFSRTQRRITSDVFRFLELRVRTMLVLVDLEQDGELGQAKQHVGAADEFTRRHVEVVADVVLVELLVGETEH